MRPLYHIFGHIHEGYGHTTDGHTQYINASTCDGGYRPGQAPIVFDLPLRAGAAVDEKTVGVDGDGLEAAAAAGSGDGDSESAVADDSKK